MADETKPPAAPAPAKAAPAAPAKKLPPVVIKPGADQKCIYTLGGHAGLFLRPDAPIQVTGEQYQTLLEDVGFQKLVEAGKIQVVE